MPESELLKVILQGGSFGLLAIAVVWMLYYGAPMIRETIKALGESHEAVVMRLTDKIEASDHEHTRQLELIAERIAATEQQHTLQLQTMDTNCREERLALAKLLANTVPAQSPVHKV